MDMTRLKLRGTGTRPPPVICFVFVRGLWLSNGGADKFPAPILDKLTHPLEDFSGDEAYRVLSVVDGDTTEIENTIPARVRTPKDQTNE